ncbi:MAG: hypothetical protein A3H99_00605 [Gallionellales bacterium RIFCSPLOWO2_02_FULL_59_110]|nr:MAG: hypothetical protein A3H99_00605 [Gallionellales bacterium RIFCSPLOWO2_02_FULL_59_110]
MVLALGFRVRSPVGVRFRQWANDKLKEYIVKGFVLDDARLKNPGKGRDYFDELPRRLQDIRTSERRFTRRSPTSTPIWFVFVRRGRCAVPFTAEVHFVYRGNVTVQA